MKKGNSSFHQVEVISFSYYSIKYSITTRTYTIRSFRKHQVVLLFTKLVRLTFFSWRIQSCTGKPYDFISARDKSSLSDRYGKRANTVYCYILIYSRWFNKRLNNYLRNCVARCVSVLTKDCWVCVYCGNCAVVCVMILRHLSVMVGVYSGPFPLGFGLYLEAMCVFLVSAVLVVLCHGDRCLCFFALDLVFLRTVAISTHIPIPCLSNGDCWIVWVCRLKFFNNWAVLLF